MKPSPTNLIRVLIEQIEEEEELLGIEEEESARQNETNAMIKHEEDIIFQTQAEILIQEEDDELFWESHLSEMAEDSHNNETSRNTTY